MGGKVVFVSNPEAIKQVFAATYDDVSSEKAGEWTSLLGASSLFVLEGPAHSRMRRLVMPSLAPERMQEHVGAIAEMTEEALDSWPLDVPFKLQAAMQALTLRTTLEILVGARSPALLRDLSRLYTLASKQVASPFILVPIELQQWIGRGPWTRLVRVSREAGELIYREIRERRAAGVSGGSDALSVLMEARDPEGRAMTDEELRDTLITLLVSGHDTTANALTWALHRLLGEPALCARLREELRAAPGGGTSDAERVLALPLLDATVREVLRMHPIFPAARRDLSRPMRLLGHDLPAGTKLATCIYLAQRRPEAFPEPDRFLPDRFLRQRPTPFEWLPFSGGMRRCVGGVSAQVQMKVVLSTILGRATLLPVAGPRVRTVSAFISLAPSGGVPAVLVSRAPRRRPLEPRPARAPA